MEVACSTPEHGGEENVVVPENAGSGHTPMRGRLPFMSTISGSSLNMTTTDTESLHSSNFHQGPFYASPGKSLHGEFLFPIQGYEIMEARSKFTIFKIKVQHIESEQQWFIFRRYTDFARLNKLLRGLFPGLRLALPPKRWFGDNFDPVFLEDRLLGLQAFITNVTSHPEISRTDSVRQFFCLDEPPDPRESLEESRLLCESLEETASSQELMLRERDLEIARLRAQLALLRQQYDLLVGRLRGGARRAGVAAPLRHRMAQLTGGTASQSASLTDLPGSDSDAAGKELPSTVTDGDGGPGEPPRP